jgi:hypothetical protein
MAGRLTLAMVATLAVLPGCQVSGVVVGVDTDLAVPGQLDGLTMRVVADGAEEFSNTSNPWSLGPGAVELPGTFTLVAKHGRPLLQVEVRGMHGDQVLVTRMASLRMVDSELLYLEMPLTASCVGVSCPDGQTCAAGACTSASVDAATLPPYRPGIERDGTVGGDGGSALLDAATGDGGRNAPDPASGSPDTPVTTADASGGGSADATSGDAGSGDASSAPDGPSGSDSVSTMDGPPDGSAADIATDCVCLPAGGPCLC